MTTQTALVLPDETQFRQDIQAINRFQAIVHQNLVADQDYGIIPGTTKPTLLKPGAEKIAKLLGLSDQYEIIDRQEDWEKPFFRYLIKCKLIHMASQGLVSEGLGECNSMESKYRWRWLSERDLPQGIDKSKLITQERSAKTGGHWSVFRFDNEDIYSQVNTILKMAKKRAMIDATLSAGRLSNVFTQDMEDITPAEEMTEGTISEAVKERRTVDKTEHYCSIHNVNFYKRGRMKGFAHPIAGTTPTEWCDELEPQPEKPPAKSSPIDDVKGSSPPEGVKSKIELKPKRDTATLKTITDMYKACHSDFGLQPKDVLAELNLNTWADLTLTPAEAYIKIASVRQVKEEER